MENGKGSRRRPSSVTDSMFKESWSRIFAKKAKLKRQKQKRDLRKRKS